MALATLGGVALPVDPETVAWTFKMKTAQIITVGGKVIQVYGTDLGDMSVSGSFGVGGWSARDRFTAQVNKWVTADTTTLHPKPLRFFMPSKGWDFRVFVKAYTAEGGEFEHSNENFAPRYGLLLFIVEDATMKVVKGIKDAYISRLMNGIGWKQSEYNGPTQDEVDAKLSPYGGDFSKYLAAIAEGTATPGGSATAGAHITGQKEAER
jgi:hypothetical protein